MVKTSEDFLHGRSHFSPYFSQRSKRDSYQIDITEALFVKLKETATENGAEYFVFYPVREDFDQRGARMAKCVQAPNSDTSFALSIDYAGLLKEVVFPSDLILYDLDGANELSVSNDDRHLGDLGNEQAMRRLAVALKIRLGRR